VALLGDGVLIIWHGMTEAGDRDMVRWHNTEHVAERVGIPGFLRGRRYADVDAPRRYVDLYETAGVETVRSAPYLARLNAPTPWTQRVLPHFRDTVRLGCRVLASEGRGQGGVALTLRLRPAAGAEDRLRAWLAGALTAALMDDAATVGVHLLETVPETTRVPTAEGRLKGGEVGAAETPWPLVLLVEAVDAGAAEELARAHLGGERLEAAGAGPDRVPGRHELELTMDPGPG
jgi:hypothetical protein